VSAFERWMSILVNIYVFSFWFYLFQTLIIPWLKTNFSQPPRSHDHLDNNGFQNFDPLHSSRPEQRSRGLMHNPSNPNKPGARLPDSAFRRQTFHSLTSPRPIPIEQYNSNNLSSPSSHANNPNSNTSSRPCGSIPEHQDVDIGDVKTTTTTHIVHVNETETPKKKLSFEGGGTVTVGVNNN